MRTDKVSPTSPQKRQSCDLSMTIDMSYPHFLRKKGAEQKKYKTAPFSYLILFVNHPMNHLTLIIET